MDKRQAIETFWTERAATFDDSADHGLRDPVVRAAWQIRFAEWMPTNPGSTVDLGCGTGSLSLLAAELGADVTGFDLSPAMIELARAKAAAASRDIDFHVGDASNPPLLAKSQSVVLARHLLFTLPEPPAVLSRWTDLLNEAGTLILIEGVWHTPENAPPPDPDYPWNGGIPATVLLKELSHRFEHVDHYPLSEQDELWGKTVTDERYAVVATRPRNVRDTTPT